MNQEVEVVRLDSVHYLFKSNNVASDITLRYQRAVGTTEYINLYRHIVECQDPIWYVYTVNDKYVIINIRTLYEGIEHNLIDFQVKTNRDETSSFAIFSLNSLRDIHAVIFEGNI